MALDQLYTDTLRELEQVKSERDALRECVGRQRVELENLSLSGDESAASEHYWQCADAIEPYVHSGPPPMERGSLSNSVVESMEFLLKFWIEAGRPESATQLKSKWQAEALREVRQKAMAAGGDLHLDIYLWDEIKRLSRQAESSDG